MAVSKVRPVPLAEFDNFSEDKVVWEDLTGELLAINPVGMEKGVNTQHGTRDAVRANIVVITGEHAGDSYTDTLVFPAGLVGQLARRMGKRLLGRLGKADPKIDQDTGQVAVDPATGEPYSGAWKFLPHTDEDKSIAVAFGAAHKLKAV